MSVQCSYGVPDEDREGGVRQRERARSGGGTRGREGRKDETPHAQRAAEAFDAQGSLALRMSMPAVREGPSQGAGSLRRAATCTRLERASRTLVARVPAARASQRERGRRTNVVEQALHHLEVPVVLAALLLGRLLEERPRRLELDLELVRRRGERRLGRRDLGEVDLEQLVRVRDAVLVSRVGRRRVGDGSCRLAKVKQRTRRAGRVSSRAAREEQRAESEEAREDAPGISRLTLTLQSNLLLGLKTFMSATRTFSTACTLALSFWSRVTRTLRRGWPWCAGTS